MKIANVDKNGIMLIPETVLTAEGRNTALDRNPRACKGGYVGCIFDNLGSFLVISPRFNNVLQTKPRLASCRPRCG